MKLTQISLFALACSTLPLAASAGVEIGINIGGPEVVVRSEPPPERVEVIPMMPGPGYIWIHGHWGWHHEHWEWINGHWDRRGGAWVWHEGHWR